MTFDADKAGLFRANPEANDSNVMRLVDPNNPGTVQVDTGTLDVSGGGEISGIRYTGKDGVAKTLLFKKQQRPDMQMIPYSLPSSVSAEELQEAIYETVDRHEVDSIVSVTFDTDTFTINHTGAGTIDKVILAGAAAGSFSRANIAGGVGVLGDAPNKPEKGKAAKSTKSKK